MRVSGGLVEEKAGAYGKTRGQSLESDLHWIGREDVVEEDWEEVQHAVEVHAGDLDSSQPYSRICRPLVSHKCDSISHSYNALTSCAQLAYKPERSAVCGGHRINSQNISRGTIGILAYFHSHMTNAAMSKTPMINVANT